MDCRDYCSGGCVIVSRDVVEDDASDETDGAEGGDGDPAHLTAGALCVHEGKNYVCLHLHHPHRSSMQRKTTNLVETNATVQGDCVGDAGLTGDGDNDVVSAKVQWDWY